MDKMNPLTVAAVEASYCFSIAVLTLICKTISETFLLLKNKKTKKNNFKMILNRLNRKNLLPKIV